MKAKREITQAEARKLIALLREAHDHLDYEFGWREADTFEVKVTRFLAKLGVAYPKPVKVLKPKAIKTKKKAKKPRKVSYEKANHVAHLLASRLGTADWLRGVGVIADKELRKSYAVCVFVDKSLSDTPPWHIKNLAKTIKGVPVHHEWRGLAKAHKSGFAEIS